MAFYEVRKCGILCVYTSMGGRANNVVNFKMMEINYKMKWKSTECY